MLRIFACFVPSTTGFMLGTASARCTSRPRLQLDGQRSVRRVEPSSRALVMRQTDATPGIGRRKLDGWPWMTATGPAEHAPKRRLNARPCDWHQTMIGARGRARGLNAQRA